MDRYQSVMEGAALWGSYYRQNPEKFAEQYLHLRLKIFQKILIVMMFWSTTFVLIACRGLGKTFLSAVYCCIRCVLYPGTKICIASGSRGQSCAVLEKIMLELIPISPELRAEIDDKKSKMNGTQAQIVFLNTSVIKVVTASDTARGNRCNVLLLDEYRLISKDVVDTVLRKFLTLRRMPRYEELTEQERQKEYNKEKNLTMYLSSAYFKDSWAYTKCEDTFRAMLDDTKRQFVCGFPYQLSISEGLLDPEMVADDMQESNFSEIKFSMEMMALWFGSEDGAFFEFESISKNRKIKYPMLPNKLSCMLPSNVINIQPKTPGELRLISADIALMPSKKTNNDATAIFVNQLLPTKSGRYISNIVYTDCYEGLRTDDQALIIRKLFDEYDGDYIVLDTLGIGLGVFDCLAKEIVDSDTGEVYPALSCCNDKTMAERCTVQGAEKVIWSIKSYAQMNSDMAFGLREAFRSGRIRLLETEYDAEKSFADLKGYSNLTTEERMKLQMPYVHTTLLINEITKLQHEEVGGKVRMYERAGMRKDRYSSLAYNYYVATQLETKVSKKKQNDSFSANMFIIKPPRYDGRR